MRIVLFSFLIATSLSLCAQNKKSVASKGNIEFLYQSFDFGNISEFGGSVRHEFKFINKGIAPVRIIDVKTSCGCTSTNWTVNEVNPGDTGSVFAVFEPEGRQGAFEKNISVMSNGSTELIDITIRGAVYATKLNQNDMYKYRYGSLAVPTNLIELNQVKYNGYDSLELAFFNMGNKRVYFYKIESPPNIQVVKTYDNVLPNSEYKLKVRYFPKKPIEFGPIRQEVKVYTNDDTLPIKIFTITANIIEDFGSLDKKALKEAPKFFVKNNTIDFGNINLFSSPSGVFEIKNKGKKDLEIRRVIKNCACLAPELSSRVIKRGQTATLKVAWNTVNMAGPDTKTIKLITNDPTQQEIILLLKANVVE
jgi:hypothetical protein